MEVLLDVAKKVLTDVAIFGILAFKPVVDDVLRHLGTVRKVLSFYFL